MCTRWGHVIYLVIYSNVLVWKNIVNHGPFLKVSWMLAWKNHHELVFVNVCGLATLQNKWCAWLWQLKFLRYKTKVVSSRWESGPTCPIEFCTSLVLRCGWNVDNSQGTTYIWIEYHVWMSRPHMAYDQETHTHVNMQ